MRINATPLLLVVCAILCLPLRGLADQVRSERWEKVPPVDWSKIKLEDFSDDELDLPFYLHHFHTVANAVEEEGPTRGFMTIPVWRGRDQNQQGPHNARVMESYCSLAFFYCTDRPWNPYFGSRAVRDRLEAMLTFWCDMQHEDGRFSEYEPQGWNLPATAFATKFMGQTLTHLRRGLGGAVVDRQLFERVRQADRKAIMVVLTRDDLFWNHGSRFTNQYTNVFPGAAAYLDLFPEDEKEIRPLLEQKFSAADKDFRSPCGYWYEKDGPDFGYTLHTHHSNAQMTYHYFGHGTPIGGALEKQEAAWNEWLGYNMLREPADGSTFVFNRGIQTRQNQANWDRQDGPFAEHVPNARAFATTREERDAWVKKTRAELSKNWGKFPELFKSGRRGSPFSPYTFVHRDLKSYYPTNAEREAVLAKLPYLANDRFIKQLKDTRKPAVYTFVRRPIYYAAFNSGPQITEQQRLGLGIVWSPKHGTLMQSQTNSDDHAWGTRADGATQIYEAGPVDATFTDDLTSVSYPLGKLGRKTVTFKEQAIEVRVEHPGEFFEHIPVLQPSNGIAALVVDLPDPDKATRRAGPELFSDKRVQTSVVRAIDSLTYELQIPASP